MAELPRLYVLGDSISMHCDHVHFHVHIREKQAAYIAGWLDRWLATSRL